LTNRLPLIAATLLLAACDRGTPVQRVDIDPERAGGPVVMEQSPNTLNASWRVAENGRALDYGNVGETPLLSLACAPTEVPPTLTIVRHAPARPGLTALFPVIGNGMRSRFPVDAKLEDGEWGWRVTLPASDPRWDVFTGSRQLLATLPGNGMLDIAGSRMPGAFVTWCRNGGQTLMPREQDMPPPDQTRPTPSARRAMRDSLHAAAQGDAAR
jgi:hypothetical protein